MRKLNFELGERETQQVSTLKIQLKLQHKSLSVQFSTKKQQQQQQKKRKEKRSTTKTNQNLMDLMKEETEKFR